MFYCRDPKFVYLDCSRCGSTSVLNHLSSCHKLEGYGDRRHYLKFPSKMAKWPKFTVVRNPYRRMASIYWMRVQNHGLREDFETWLRRIDPWKWAQRRYARLADHVFQIENIDEARKLSFWPKTEFPHKNDSKKRTRPTRRGTKWEPMPDPEKLLTREAKRIIARKFGEDFEELGYRK